MKRLNRKPRAAPPTLPELDQTRRSVLNSLTSLQSVDRTSMPGASVPSALHARRGLHRWRPGGRRADCANCGPPGMQGLRCLRASDCANCSPPGRQGLPSRAKRVGGATPHLFATRRDLLADFTASSACSRPWASMECLKSQIVSGCAVTRALFALHPPRLGKHHATNGGSYLSPIAVN